MADTWTPVPNHIIALMPRLGPPATMVVFAVARKTAGWQKMEDTISISQFEELTGLSRQGVITAIEKAIAVGVIARTPDKRNGFRYRLVNDVDQSEQSSTLTSTRSGLDLVNDVDQSTPQLVNDVDTQKKDLKERKKVDAPAAPAAPPAPVEKAKRERKPRPTDPNQTHPAVLAFYEKTARRPNKEQAHLIASRVTDTDRWLGTITFWLQRGWSAMNIGGMVSRYERLDDRPPASIAKPSANGTPARVIEPMDEPNPYEARAARRAAAAAGGGS